jgi:hypothetical protein
MTLLKPFFLSFLCLVMLLSPSLTHAITTGDNDIFSRAGNGDVNAQSYVAHLYATGKKVERDYEKARYWYQQIADHKDADAKIVAHANLLLGLMYTSGKGGGQNYTDAMKCFQVAAEQGYFDAHIGIGNLYAYGLGVEQDLNKALHWWELALKEGHPKAAHLVRLLRQEISARQSG